MGNQEVEKEISFLQTLIEMVEVRIEANSQDEKYQEIKKRFLEAEEMYLEYKQELEDYFSQENKAIAEYKARIEQLGASGKHGH